MISIDIPRFLLCDITLEILEVMFVFPDSFAFVALCSEV